MSRMDIVNGLIIVVASALTISGSSFAGSDGAGGVYAKALTLTPDMENGKELYVVCSSCHLQEGWGLQDGTYPQIAGQHRSVLIQQLSDIRAHNRDNPTMYPFALPEAIGDEHDIADVAGYIESMKMSPDNGKGAWAEGTPEFAQGKQLFADNCAQCHGKNGEGDPSKLLPKIQGQHYKYMLRQLEWMREGKRRGVNHSMLTNLNIFTPVKIAHVVNFVSRIPVAKRDIAPSADWKNPDFN
jgi:cytochrome c553